MLRIQPIDIASIPQADWFFFYSKNGVEVFAKLWQDRWQSAIHNPIKWAAMGPGTADSMKGWGMHCDFVGHGEAEEVANQFLDHSKPTDSVVFYRAYHSRDRLYELIAPHRDSVSLPIYDNQMLKKTFAPVHVGIFTSSRNAIAFLDHNPVPENLSIAIGTPTADTLRSLSIPSAKIRLSNEPSEESIAKTLNEVLSDFSAAYGE